MPLITAGEPAALIRDRRGVIFTMKDDARAIRVLVSLQALEDIDPPDHGEKHIERFNEYRLQFEEIARQKYDKGFVEQDGTICIRGRDLPGLGAI
jgi:hypothetical protein